MKTLKRIPAVLLSASLLLASLPPVQAAQSGTAGVTGSVTAALRIDYRQPLSQLQKRGVQAELFQGGRSLGKADLTRPASSVLGGYQAEVSLRDRLGGELTGSALPGALDLTVEGLAPGSYTLRFSGAGYRTCAVPFAIGEYDQYIEVGTGDGTFSLGDLNGDGQVNSRDTDALAAVLGSAEPADLDRYDLNGDGKIDIVDLAYVNRSAGASGQPTVLDTASSKARAEESETARALAQAGTVTQTGSAASLLQPGGGYGEFRAPSSAGQEISIPVVLASPVEAQELRLVTPDAAPGTVQAGTVEVEWTSGTVSVPFASDNTMYAGVRAVTRTPGSNVISIDLGRRVAVKKVTITVTRTAGGEYAALESIQFLKNIVPEDLAEPNSLVKNLRAEAGDSQVSLTWSALSNVSGYRVDYWQEGRESARRQLNVDVPRAQVAGLENLKTYFFTVTPTDGNWQGQTCDPVSTAPQPAKAPDAPDMVAVAELDGALRVSWKAGKTATYYEVYYTGQANAPVSSYRQTGGQVTGTSLTINGLSNGTTYSLYVIAGNDVGRSAPSRISSGTPKATDYSRPAGIPAKGVLEGAAIERVWLADSGNISSGSYSAAQPFQTGYMNDGDFRTHWTSQSWGDGNWARSKQVFASFRQPVDLSSVIWVPRLDGGYANNLRRYTVTVWRQGDDLNGPGTLVSPDPLHGGSASDLNTWEGVRGNPGVTRFAVLPFQPVTGVVQIAVTIDQVGYTAVSLSELMFMEYDPEHSLTDNIAALFADDLRTQLASGATQERINALKDRLEGDERTYYLNLDTLADELKLAQELLTAEATSGVVLRGIQSRSSARDSEKYQQGGSGLQPLGIAAKAGQEITVYAAGIPQGETVTLYASQYNAEVSAWLAQMGTLSNGRNILTVPKIGSQSTERGGSLYLTYSGSAPQNIQLHIRRGTDIPVLELSGWYGLEDSVRRARIGDYVKELSAYVAAQGINSGNAGTSCLNVTELSLPSVLLSIPAKAVLDVGGADQAEKLYQNVLAWEDMMHICKTTQGIDQTYDKNDMTSRQNIRCMQMFAGAFMYAAGSHIGIGYGSCGGVVSGLPIAKLETGAASNHLFGWGIAHEIGHNMDKLGRAEITNNLYSLMVQTCDGKDNTFASRLESSGKYPAVFTKTAQGWPGASNDVFVQLAMYWQLHLAYDGAQKDEKGPMWFYNQFFKAWKAGTYTGGFTGLSIDEKAALTAAGVVQKDLTEFFTRWGVTLGQPVRDKLAGYSEKETRAIWYLSDQSRRERLKGTQAAAGTVHISTCLEGENTVAVSIQASLTNQGKLQGFEILRGGTPIAFATPGEDGSAVYRDVIGSANHRTYTYQVRAYDILGNQMAQGQAQPVRIAYDKEVDRQLYDVAVTGGTAVITVKDGKTADTAGLKLTGDSRPASGAFEITAAARDGKTCTLRSGDFGQSNLASDDKNSWLTYFQKPGAGPEDTRIWTYAVKTVTVTGLPAGVKAEDIHLLADPGDDVAFLEGGAVGLLSEDYRYGDGADEVIPKGTLVIAGTYRGDPRFNTLKIEGKFVQTTDEGVVTETERPLDGYALLFAEIPKDGAVSDISDGIFLFVPNVQKEAELQEVSQCSGANLLPAQMRAVLSRTGVSGSAESQRVTAETRWMGTPGGQELPAIELKGDSK